MLESERAAPRPLSSGSTDMEPGGIWISSKASKGQTSSMLVNPIVNRPSF